MVIAGGVAGLADCHAQGCHIHLAEVVAKGGIGGWSPQLQAKRLVENSVVAGA